MAASRHSMENSINHTLTWLIKHQLILRFTQESLIFLDFLISLFIDSTKDKLILIDKDTMNHSILHQATRDKIYL